MFRSRVRYYVLWIPYIIKKSNKLEILIVIIVAFFVRCLKTSLSTYNQLMVSMPGEPWYNHRIIMKRILFCGIIKKKLCRRQILKFIEASRISYDWSISLLIENVSSNNQSILI